MLPSLTKGKVGLIVHGGAWNIPDEALEDHRDGLQRAVHRGRQLLKQCTSALDTVAGVVAVMEAHPAFDAGMGSVLNRSRRVEMDAGLMCGYTLGFGAVAGVEHLAHPIRVARRLLSFESGQARLLVGKGAEDFAVSQGVKLISNESLVVPRERQRFEHLQENALQFHTSHAFMAQGDIAPRGTVGCVAIDRNGYLAAATSTGGAPYTLPGRVGDSPLPGCGYYANGYAAVSSTGWGEAISAILLAGRAVDRVAAGQSPEMAVRAGLQQMHEAIQNRDGKGATGGLIMMDRTGRAAWAFSTPRMARGGWMEGGSAWMSV